MKSLLLVPLLLLVLALAWTGASDADTPPAPVTPTAESIFAPPVIP